MTSNQPDHSITPAPTCGPVVTVWRVRLDLLEPQTGSALKLLSPEEAKHADTIRDSQRRRGWILTHATLRSLLADALDVHPASVSFTLGPHGKPGLSHNERAPLHFNLSHSGRLALVAISSAAEVGVDVEHLRPMPDRLRLANRFFTPKEAAALAALPEADQSGAFFRLWTGKEALLKATGLGLANGLQRFELSTNATGGLLSVDGDSSQALQWTLHQWSPAEGYAAAVAIALPQAQVAVREFAFPANTAERQDNSV